MRTSAALPLKRLSTLDQIYLSAFWFSTPMMWGAILANFSNNFATAPYSALLPDVVPVEQRGAASGRYGLMTTLGALFVRQVKKAW